MLLPPKINGSNQLSSFKLHVLESHSFRPVKLFALDVNLLAVPGKTNGDKLVSIKKNFYHVDGFGGVFISSKFPGIIRSTFTSEASMNKAKSLAVNEKILVNDELKKVHSCSNQEIVVKEILVDLLKSAVELVFSKFGEIVSIRLQLVGLWQKALVEFKSAEIVGVVAFKWLVFMGKDSVNQHQALLYTLPVETTAHDLSDLLESYGRKTCFIGCNPVSYVCDRCAIVCFDDETARLAAISTISIFKGVSLCWASLVLASCAKYEQLGHIHADCSVGGSSGAHGKRVVSDQDWICLAGIYKKKSAPIACPVSFGGKTWAQVAGGTPSHVFLSGSSGYDLHSGLVPPLVVSDPLVVSHLSDHLAILECSLELLADCVSGILVRLDSFGVVPLAPSSLVSPSVVSAALGSEVDSDIIVDNALSSSGITLPVTNDAIVNLSASGFKVLTAKMGGLETKLVALEASVGLVLDKLNLLCSGLGLYTGASSVIRFSQAGNINSFIAKVMNESFFIILGGDFNEDSSHKCASFNKCFDLGLVNSLGGSLFVKSSTWCNFCGVAKTIDYVFVSFNLINTVVDYSVAGVDEFFDTDYKAVSVFVGINGLLDVQLSSLHKQANRDHWKFDIKCASEVKWLKFKNAMADNASMFSDAFVMARKFSNIDEMWNVVQKIMVLSADGTFKKKWFKSFDSVFNKVLSRFHKLELLVSKLVRNSCLVSGGDFALLLETWDKLDFFNASVVKFLFLSGSGFNPICSALAKARKLYCASKLLKSKHTEESSIKQAINRKIESFELDKDYTIRSVLEHSFHKVVLDHLVVGDELVLEPDSVKSKVDEIMEGWTRKHRVVSDISGDWHVFNGAFSGVMCPISFDEMLAVIKDLPDGKVAGFSGISNELWKCCDKSVLDMLLGTSTQSPIFAVSSVIEDALEKNRELWLVLQNMRKAYNSVG
ncbi:hypothetical protein G9A89_022476 [Geosiphon pyriformis]|nr:hypothetical protein G9A89_022476 [Geosiphon pyriformis]